jgi:general secretion pathway protein B
MSYILEALKKAQAERQLGDAPTIHAPQAAQATPAGAAAGRKPLLLGLGAGAVVVAVGALLFWKQAPAPVAPVVAARTPAVVPAPALAPAPAASGTLDVSAPPAPVVPSPPTSRLAQAPAAPAAAPVPPVPPVPAPVAAVRAVPPPTVAAAPRAASAPEDSLPFLQQLPEPLRGEVPRVAFGGYMYSANPADRLLIVDKALRREGDEIAPGLVLEKLLPKTAVLNYRGTRYRVPY